jgi:hypothetical protein
LVGRRYTLVTPLGERVDPSEAEVDRAVEAAREVDGAFVVLQRDDGAFVRFDGTALEWNPGARLQRFDVTPRARETFRRFAGGEDVSTTVPWRDVEGELARADERRRVVRRRVFAIMVALAVALVVATSRRVSSGSERPARRAERPVESARWGPERRSR